jgi:hypothetical protein
MIGTGPAFQLCVLCLSFTRNAPSNYEFAYAPLVRALTSSTGVLVGNCPPGTPLCAKEQQTDSSHLRDCSSAAPHWVRRRLFSPLWPADARREELAGGIVHDSREPQRRHLPPRTFDGYVRISKHLLSLSPEVFYFLVCYGVVKVPPLLQYVVFVAPVITSNPPAGVDRSLDRCGSCCPLAPGRRLESVTQALPPFLTWGPFPKFWRMQF